MRIRTHHGTMIALLAFALAGCGEKPTAAPPAAVDPPPADSGPAIDPALVPETPEGAIHAVVDGIKRHHPEALWYFLPAGYQRDVNEVVHDFANRMDAEVWNRTTAVLKKAARVVKSQKELIRTVMNPKPIAGGPPMPPPIDFEGIAGLLETLVKSDLGNLERLKTADMGEFLKTTGGQFLRQLEGLSKMVPSDSLSLKVDELSQMKVTLVSREGDHAVVLLEPPGREPAETEFVRVEGKWVPRELAESWIEGIGQAKARLSLLSAENIAEFKPRLLTLLEEIDQVLDQLAAAKDKEQLGAALQGFLAPGLILGAMLQPQFAPQRDEAAPPSLAAPPDGGPRDSEIVTILVRGRLSERAQGDLLDKLTAAADKSDDPFVEFTSDDELTSFKIGPVSDVEAFARSLEFLDVVEVDAKGRKITARGK